LGGDRERQGRLGVHLMVFQIEQFCLMMTRSLLTEQEDEGIAMLAQSLANFADRF